jgi:hypothetical protein
MKAATGFLRAPVRGTIFAENIFERLLPISALIEQVDPSLRMNLAEHSKTSADHEKSFGHTIDRRGLRLRHMFSPHGIFETVFERPEQDALWILGHWQCRIEWDAFTIKCDSDSKS